MPWSRTRIAALTLTLVLVCLLTWSLATGFGDFKTRAIILMGIVLGVIYTLQGKLPEQLIDWSHGRLTADDDPSNISPKVYLPIVLGVIVIAFVALVTGLMLL